MNLLIFLKTNRTRQKEILKLIRTGANTNGQSLLDDEFEIMCFFIIDTISDLRGFIDRLHKRFKWDILDYETHLMIHQIYNDFFPKGVYEDIIKD